MTKKTLHIPAVYLESNSTWYSSSGGVSIITRGEDVYGTLRPTSDPPQTNYKPVAMAGSGVFLKDRAGWVQEATLNINITDSAPGTIEDTPHTHTLTWSEKRFSAH